MTVVIHNKQYTPKFTPGDKVWVVTDTYEFTKGEIIDVVLTVCGDNKTVLARYNVACEDVAGEGADTLYDVVEGDIYSTELEARRRQLQRWARRKAWLQEQLELWDKHSKALMDRILELERSDDKSK